jgi:DNA-binding MarR family transcriptional regulator
MSMAISSPDSRLERLLNDRYPAVDFSEPAQVEIAYRVAIAWRELRRGAAAQRLRGFFLGTDETTLDQGQMDTLDVLVTRKRWRMSELADALRVDPSTATRAVGRLINVGLAERSVCDVDGRVVQVAASRAGRNRHRAISKRRAIALSRLLGAFDPDERVLLAGLLDRFVGAIDDLATDLVAVEIAEQQAAAAAAAAETTIESAVATPDQPLSGRGASAEQTGVER